jgi:cytochrome c
MVKITAAIMGAIVFIAVCAWLATDVYDVTYPGKSASEGSGLTEPAEDLAALQGSWPQALGSAEARVRLLSYMRELPREVASNAPPGEAAPEPALDLQTRLVRADLARGQRSSNKCAACHTFEKGEPARVGPNLWGAVGRAVAKQPGFSYSDELVAKGGNWTPEELDLFLANPLERVPGTRMGFLGLPDQQERADLITFLNMKSDNPQPL